MQERLQKIIAQAGIASRREAEKLILEGRVTLNNKVVNEPGTKADIEKDIIKVDSKKIPFDTKKVYILLNKPKGCISTAFDPQDRPTVVALVKTKQRIFPIGRLDFDAEGAILLTNDGELTNKLIHPRYKVPKKYLVKVSDVPDERDIEKLRKGVHLEDGRTLPAEVKFVKKTETNSWLEITVYEGRNRLIKRMCFAIGHSVLKLKRIEFAGIKVGNLKPAEYRFLTTQEVDGLKMLF